MQVQLLAMSKCQRRPKTRRRLLAQLKPFDRGACPHSPAPAGTQKRKRTRDGRQKLLNKLAQVCLVPAGWGCCWLPCGPPQLLA